MAQNVVHGAIPSKNIEDLQFTLKYSDIISLWKQKKTPLQIVIEQRYPAEVVKLLFQHDAKLKNYYINE